MVTFFNALAVLSALVGAVIATFGIVSATGAPQQAAAAAVGLCWAIIPYCIARVFHERARDAGPVAVPSVAGQALAWGGAFVVLAALATTVAIVTINAKKIVPAVALETPSGVSMPAPTAARLIPRDAVCEQVRQFAHDRIAIEAGGEVDVAPCAGATVRQETSGLWTVLSQARAKGDRIDFGAVVRYGDNGPMICRYGQNASAGGDLNWSTVSECS